jgi:5-(carboxyamino)imidazole ribonucleotide synthase
MLAMEAARLGFKTHIYCDEAMAPAFDVAAQRTVGSYADRDALARFAGAVDIVTCEFENVPAETLEAAARVAPVCPSPKSFAVAQDRLTEKDLSRSRLMPPSPASPICAQACGR